MHVGVGFKELTTEEEKKKRKKRKECVWAARILTNYIYYFHCPLREIRVALRGYKQEKNPECVLVAKSLSFFFLLKKFSLSLAGNSGKVQQPQEQRYPFLSVCAVFSCIQTTVWLPVFGNLNVRTYTDACDCTRGMYGHCKSLHWKLTLGEKALAKPGTRTRVSTAPGFSVGLTELSPPSYGRKKRDKV